MNKFKINDRVRCHVLKDFDVPRKMSSITESDYVWECGIIVDIFSDPERYSVETFPKNGDDMGQYLTDIFPEFIERLGSN